MLDTSLYDAENKANLASILSEQASLKSTLEDAELLWLEAQELLEQANTQFEQNTQDSREA